MPPPIQFKRPRRTGLGDDLTDDYFYGDDTSSPSPSPTPVMQGESAYDVVTATPASGTPIMQGQTAFDSLTSTPFGTSPITNDLGYSANPSVGTLTVTSDDITMEQQAAIANQATSSVTTTDAASTSAMDALIKSLPALANGLAQYKKVSLPGGGAIYQRINPATGLPYATSTTLSMAQFTAWIQANPMLALGGLALILFLVTGKRGRRNREDD